MEIREMSMEDVEKAINELNAKFDEIEKKLSDDDAELDVEATEEEVKSLEAEKEELNARKAELVANAEKRNALAKRVAEGNIGTVVETSDKDEQSKEEERAKNMLENGRTTRSVIASGKIATPTQVGGINELAAANTSIVDDVKAVALKGNGTYKVAYKKKGATATDVTDGSKIGGTGAEYDYVDINPAEVGVVDEISAQIAKLTPVDYEANVASSALTALREAMATKILTKVKASDLAEAKTVALDVDFLRTLMLGFNSIVGKGEVVLYINRADLATLGKVRGTNEKAPRYEIEFDEGTTLSGKIKEGGLACKFRVVEGLEGQLFGQPQTIEMPMWDDFAIETDEHEKFSSNMIVVRGLQTANADLCAYHGMQVITQA